MTTIILAVVQSPDIKEMLESLRDRFSCRLEFAVSLGEYFTARQEMHVGLMILEYQLIQNEPDDQSSLFYEVKCPCVVVNRIGNRMLSFPILNAGSLKSEGEDQGQELVNLVNEYYQPLPEASLNAVDRDLEFITRNTRMEEIYRNAVHVAKFNTHVLLQGESGTGKGILAEIIHRRSKRSSHQMIKVNCAAIPANLLEAEMFGFQKGAFTGAFQDKIGKIQMANGSTLFLDEIGDMAYPLQAKLLRVIETGEVDMIGSNQPVNVDIRIVSATNRDLRTAVSRKEFREDLFYRLNVVTFHLLPLRDRPEDIPLLVQHFLTIYSRKYNIIVGDINSNQLGRLFDYHWPGNVRELSYFVERLVLRCQDQPFDLQMIEQELEALIPPDSHLDRNKTLEKFIEQQEKNFIIRTLTKCDYKILKTAAHLGVNRVSLFRRMKKYQIDVRKLKSAL